MCKENTVYLLVGQRGAGKSEYAAKIVAQQPEIQLVNRDVILERLFGSEHRYEEEFAYGEQIMMRLLRRKLATAAKQKILLDAWTATSAERSHLIRNLHECGATSVIALYFITPLAFVNEWFWKKPGIAKVGEMKTRKEENLTFFLEDAPANDYEVFHRFAAAIGQDGFDKVVHINPTWPVIVL